MQQPKPIRFLDRTTPPHVVTLIALTSLGSLSMSIFLPSLNAMARDLGTEYHVMQLSVSLYLIGNAVLQLLIGPLADRYGRRPVLLGGMTIFLLASIGCALAQSATTFLLFRMIQAAVVAGMMLSRAVIRDLFDERESAAKIGSVMMVMSIVPLIGPSLGGLLDSSFGWRASFILLMGLGAAALVLVYADLGETAKTIGRPIGAQFRDYPALLGSLRFWVFALGASFASGCFFAFLGGGPWVGENIFGLSPGQVGLALGSPAVGYAIGNFLSSRYSVRLGVERMLFIGSVITGLGILTAIFLHGTDIGGAWGFFLPLTFMALGNGMVMPNSAAGMMSVQPRLAGSAAGLGGALQILGGALLAWAGGQLLHPGGTGLPLLVLMFLSSCAAMILFALLPKLRRAQAS